MKPRCSANNDFIRVPPVYPVRRPRPNRLLWSAASVLIAAGMILHYFNPTEHRFYPACMFHALTGLNCPGCGSLRALHHLTHGEFTEAFHSNPLLIVGLPMALLAAMRGLIHQRHQPPPAVLFNRPVVVWTMLAIIFTFGVLRNLPFPAFTWMSP